MADEAKLCSPLLLKYWLWCALGRCGEEYGALLTVAGCRLLLVHLINLLRILLRYGFAKIQKAVAIRQTVDCQTLELLGPATELVVVQIHFSSHITIHLRYGSLLLPGKKMTLQNWYFWIVVSSEICLWSFFTFPVCFRCWMTIQWLMLSSLALCSVVVTGSASMMTVSLSLLNFQYLDTAFHFKTLGSFAKLFESLLHYMCISSCWAKCVVDCASFLHGSMTCFELQ